MSNFPYVSSRVITNTFVNDEFEYSICYNQSKVNYNTLKEEQKITDDLKKYLESNNNRTEDDD